MIIIIQLWLHWWFQLFVLAVYVLQNLNLWWSRHHPLHLVASDKQQKDHKRTLCLLVMGSCLLSVPCLQLCLFTLLTLLALAACYAINPHHSHLFMYLFCAEYAFVIESNNGLRPTGCLPKFSQVSSIWPSDHGVWRRNWFRSQPENHTTWDLPHIWPKWVSLLLPLVFPLP